MCLVQCCSVFCNKSKGPRKITKIMFMLLIFIFRDLWWSSIFILFDQFQWMYSLCFGYFYGEYQNCGNSIVSKQLFQIICYLGMTTWLGLLLLYQVIRVVHVHVLSLPVSNHCLFNTLRPRQNGRRFADDTFKRIFLNENARISIKISLKFVPKGPINNNPTLVQIMIILLTHICVTRPPWVKNWNLQKVQK